MDEARRLDEADEILEIPISYEERGKKKGLEEGLERGKKEVALELLKKGLDIDLIVEATKLSLDEIKKLQKQLEK
ncbi:hypothetical protein [Pseudogracilibacillus sp. SO30301A]|uniref:hypothetical protein n=1 Tax=Pseudogracilibacillus sp. SO30301A TaxID=3098291 RepID=UPI00300E4691